MYRCLARHYESCFALYGDTHRGVDWPDAKGAETRYGVMLDLVRPSLERKSLLDFGCGAGHFYDFLKASGRTDIHYRGLDISDTFISLCQKKYPEIPFYCTDILEKPLEPGSFDYVVANGVFTEKRELGFDEMFSFLKDCVRTLYSLSRVGIAFNVMSSHVEWERDDLFHLPMDRLADFLTQEFGRSFTFRNDYGLYEYTTYLYR